MEALTTVKVLTRDSRSILSSAAEENSDDGLQSRQTGSEAESDNNSTSSDYILAVLKSKPGHDNIAQVLAILDPSNKKDRPPDFDIRVPSAKTTQILNVLVNITIPDHWEYVKETKGQASKLRGMLLRCFSSVAGLSCLVTQLRSLITAARAGPQNAEGSSNHIRLAEILSVISALLKPTDFVLRLYNGIDALYTNETQKQLAWKEIIALLGASKLLPAAAEALSLIKDLDGLEKISWLGEGTQYASWLGVNICHIVSRINPNDDAGLKAVALLTARSLSIGYTDHLVREIYSGLLLGSALPTHFDSFYDKLRPTEQLAFLESVFRDLQKKYFPVSISYLDFAKTSGQNVEGVAALCSIIISKSPHLMSQVSDWLAKGQAGSIYTVGLRRALLAALSDRKDIVQALLSKSLEQSGDKFYIRHAPMASQEANAQVVLLAAGCLQRLDSCAVKDAGWSSIFLNTVSNRLAASSSKARFLGMIIGTAISQLIEEPGKAMKFDLEEMESDEAVSYLDLVKKTDRVGSLDYIKISKEQTPNEPRSPAQRPSSSRTEGVRASNAQSVKIVSIEEIGDSENDENEEDDDLIPYEKPDDDPSDSDDDPTLVNRNKPTPPVYIRDLIAGLRDTENLERYDLAVTTAPSLIRRKTGFGTELAENVEELALVLVGLQEQAKLPKFHECRLQSMIALIVSQPLKMGRWFGAVFFDGDLSQTQRSAVLTALGLSARELAGNGEEDARTLGLPTLPDTSFPTRRLPANVENLYLTNESPIASLTKTLSKASLEPLAAQAADAVSGPNALKVRTFSSRMDVEKKRQQRDAQRQKSTVKNLYKVLSEGFFYPLTGRFGLMMTQFSSSTAPSYNPFLIPHLLCLFIQTLTLILSTMGPHNPYLPNLTQETLNFLLSLYTRPLSEDPSIVSALLSLFLAVVDLNVASGSSGEERLVTEFATQVIELREWAGSVFDRTVAAQGADDPREQVRLLAAGVMVKLGEVTERYQGRLMGVNSGFKY
ncbi:DNA replication checkpoint protein tel2 [Aspergillus udagawae]|uniref:DNA replication checkpoint protein tel2 n=1 Tax=Aspergillus udagawae TaxID=91492 RepID=A0A8H3SBV4_9EURO|nr:DNA replication checkpoint protein tel2 [Aspergillus udagawae]